MRFQVNHSDVLSQPKMRTIRKKFDMQSLEKETGWRVSSKKPLDLKVKDRQILYTHDDLPNAIKNGALTSGNRDRPMLNSDVSSPLHRIKLGEEESLFKTQTDKPTKALRALIAGKFSNDGNNNYSHVLPGSTLVG